MELNFRNYNRPARRYLYFKYIITYLTAKEIEETSWASRSQCQGTMWCSPGPFVRDSMLRVLARQVSDLYLPEALISAGTFTEAADISSRPKDEEQVLAMSLGLKIEDERVETLEKPWEGCESDDDDNDNEDNY